MERSRGAGKEERAVEERSRGQGGLGWRGGDLLSLHGALL